MSFRKEKKYRLTYFEFDILKHLLLQQGMKKLYEPREINSLYYDTELKDMFYHSEEGVLPRKKVRIRWYKNPEDCNIETKISSIEGRFKTSRTLSQSIHEEFPRIIMDKSYGPLVPSLLVAYSREYYVLNGLRITFDSSITYCNYRLSLQDKFNDPERVMEVKISSNTEDDFIKKIIPYSTKRFSKYSRGLLISYGEI